MNAKEIMSDTQVHRGATKKSQLRAMQHTNPRCLL